MPLEDRFTEDEIFFTNNHTNTNWYGNGVL